jgi:L-arabinose isomerase
MDMGNRFRIVSNEVEIVNPDEPLPNLPVACAVWKPKPSFATASEAWIYAGGSHHTVLSTALGVDTLVDFSKIANVELLRINDETEINRFQKEIQWNDLYFSSQR